MTTEVAETTEDYVLLVLRDKLDSLIAPGRFGGTISALKHEIEHMQNNINKMQISLDKYKIAAEELKVAIAERKASLGLTEE